MAPLVLADIGSVSHGTLRTEDLLSVFADTLEELLDRQPRHWRGSRPYRKLLTEARHTNPDGEFASETVADLQCALDKFAPPYGYFGNTEGDGSDFGFWIDYDNVRSEFSGPKVDTLRKVPRRYSGHVLLVYGSESMTLYRRTARGKLTELWSTV